MGIWTPGPGPTSGDDTFTGDATAETAAGGDGNDTLNGNGGGDTLRGEAGDDELNGGDGDDFLYGDRGPGESGNANVGDYGHDILNGGIGADTMVGGDGNDTYYVDNVGDVVIEQSTVKGIIGVPGIDHVYSSVSFVVGAGIEQLTLTGDLAINGTSTGNGSLNGEVTITGNNAANILTGASTNDTLIGMGGDDTLDGRGGVDTMTGGLGNDTYVLDHAADVVIEQADEGIDTVRANFTYTLIANVENLVLTDSAAINGYGNSLDNAITGNSAANLLDGGAGNDILDGGAGADIMVGGLGNDVFYIDQAGDVAIEAADAGVDEVRATYNYTLGANIENLTLLGTAATAIGNALSNTLTGNASNNILNGLDGADTMIGGLGDDTYIIDNLGDVVVELAGQGRDTIVSSISFTLPETWDVEEIFLTGAGSLTATGNALANWITGNAGANTLNGAGGDDILDGGIGNDVLDGGAGIDTATFVNSVTGVTVDLRPPGVGTANGAGSGADQLFNIENIIGTGFTDFIYGSAGVNVIQGGAGDDFIEGGAGGDTLDGGAGQDFITYGSSSAGVSVNLATGAVSGGDAQGDIISNFEHIIGSDFSDSIVGTSGANIIASSGGNDFINGGDGDDLLDGGAGADAINGGAGLDTARYSSSTVGVTVSLATGLGSGGEAQGDILTSIENLIGSAFADTLTGDANANLLSGLAGADILNGGGGIDTADYTASAAAVTVNLATGLGSGGDAQGDTLTAIENVWGSAFADTLTGDGAANFLRGFDGNDTLIGGPGDVMDGGNGVDTVQLGGGNVDYRSSAFVSIERIQFTQAGTAPTVNAMVNATQIGAGLSSTLVVSGSPAQDSIQVFVDENASVNISGWTFNFPAWSLEDYVVFVGANGNESFTGFQGLDIFFGSPGNDTYNGGGAFDFAAYIFSPNAVTADLAIVGAQQIGGNQGFDTFIGLEGLAGSQLSDQLYGDNGGNILLGLYGDDLLVGRGGDDDLRGAEGSDILYGGLGADVLWGYSDITGGADGADTFRYLFAAEGGDTIRDFQAGIDRIEISASGFGFGLVAGQPAPFTSGVNPVATGTSGQFLYNTSNGQLSWDADGTGAGAAVLLATLLGAPALTAAGIVVTNISGSLADDASGDQPALLPDAFDFEGLSAAASLPAQDDGALSAMSDWSGMGGDAFDFADAAPAYLLPETTVDSPFFLDVQRTPGVLGADGLTPV